MRPAPEPTNYIARLRCGAALGSVEVCDETVGVDRSRDDDCVGCPVVRHQAGGGRSSHPAGARLRAPLLGLAAEASCLRPLTVKLLRRSSRRAVTRAPAA